MIGLELLGADDPAQETVRNIIRKSEFFSDLDDAEIESLSTWAKAYSAPIGSTVFQEGKDDANLCFLMEGEMDIFKEVASNEYIRIARVTSGATLGEMGIVDGQPLSATAIPASACIVLMITRADFEELVKQNAPLGVKLLWRMARIISLRLRQTTGLLADISIMSDSGGAA